MTRLKVKMYVDEKGRAVAKDKAFYLKEIEFDEKTGRIKTENWIELKIELKKEP